MRMRMRIRAIENELRAGLSPKLQVEVYMHNSAHKAEVYVGK